MDNYPIVDGRVKHDRPCELMVVHHCNLRCQSCNSFSPIMPAVFSDPAAIEADLDTLGRVYTAKSIRVLGGEPLLHPQLAEILRRVRRSIERTSMARAVTMCTNGLLLDSRGAEVWELVEEIEISVYPGRCISNRQLDEYRARAERHGVALLVLLVDSFRTACSELGTDDDRTVDRIFKTCQTAHVWRCHLLQDGYLYRCPQSYFLHAMPGGMGNATEDGLKIGTGEGFRDELKRFLDSPIGPAACRRCRGRGGTKLPHTQLPRTRWFEPLRGPSEPLLDWAWMELLERDPGADDGFRYLKNDESIPAEWYA
jgi:hypothetical protein